MEDADRVLRRLQGIARGVYDLEAMGGGRFRLVSELETDEGDWVTRYAVPTELADTDGGMTLDQIERFLDGDYGDSATYLAPEDV